MMHIVIVEDEPLLQQRLVRLATKYLEDKKTRICCFDNIDDADSYLRDNSVDLLLLDLNLHGRNGFELLKLKVAAAYHTIIVSAYSDKAPQAFEYGVLDFVVKPFTEERLAKALDRILDGQQRSHYGCRYLSVDKAGSIELVALVDIAYIQAEGHYSLLHLIKSQVSKGESITVLHGKSIEKITHLLPENFCRIHRSYLVNMNLVQRLTIRQGSRYGVILTTGERLPVGRTRINEIRQRLGE